MRSDQERRRRTLVRLGCLLMVAAAGAWAAYAVAFEPEKAAGDRAWTVSWFAAYAAFVGAYLVAELDGAAGPTRRRGLMLAVQALLALYMVWLYPSFLVTSLVVVVAWQIASAASLRTALAATAAVTAAMVAMKCVDQTDGMSLVVLLSSCGFQLFAVSAAHLARSEAAAREDLARTNAELLATQTLLTESARMSERLQISRDLHDVLGHNLTSLAIHLDVAARMSEGQAAQHVGCARDVAGALLDQVRDVVGRVRVQPVHLRNTLVTLTEGVAGLKVRLDLPDDLSAMDPARADAILRCVQELITNALRHADATSLAIELRQGLDGAVTVSAQDDGRGGPIVEGLGLAGMRERFEALGGSLTFAAEPGRGFRLRGAMPAWGALL